MQHIFATAHSLTNSILQAFTPPSLHMAQQELEKLSHYFFQIFLVILSKMGHLCNICEKDVQLFTAHSLTNSILQAFTPPFLHMAQQELEKHSQWWELQSILVAWPELSMSYLKLWNKPRQNSSSKVLMSSLVFSLNKIMDFKLEVFRRKSIFHVPWIAKQCGQSSLANIL